MVGNNEYIQEYKQFILYATLMVLVDNNLLNMAHILLLDTTFYTNNSYIMK